MTPYSGAILIPVVEKPLPSDDGAECDAGEAVAPPCLIKLSKSDLVTRPFFPVPVTALMSIPSFFARCLTAGVDNALADEDRVILD